VRLIFITLLALVLATVVGLGATWMTATRGTDLGTLKIGAWTARPKTGTADVIAVQPPPRDRSNNCNLPRIEFQSGATATINCEQSAGTPSARTLLATIIATPKQIPRKIDINIRKCRRTAY